MVTHFKAFDICTNLSYNSSYLMPAPMNNIIDKYIIQTPFLDNGQHLIGTPDYDVLFPLEGFNVLF